MVDNWRDKAIIHRFETPYIIIILSSFLSYY